MIGFLNFGFTHNIAHIAVASGENVTEVFPAKMFHQVVIVENDILKPVSRSSH